jgi:hypothetical protein
MENVVKIEMKGKTLKEHSSIILFSTKIHGMYLRISIPTTNGKELSLAINRVYAEYLKRYWKNKKGRMELYVPFITTVINECSVYSQPVIQIIHTRCMHCSLCFVQKQVNPMLKRNHMKQNFESSWDFRTGKIY